MWTEREFYTGPGQFSHMKVSKRHIYGIIGHQVMGDKGAPGGIELYTE